MSDTFKCPLRGLTFRSDTDKWVTKDGVLQCSYCGSIPPEEFKRDLNRASNPFDRTHIQEKDGDQVLIHRARSNRGQAKIVMFNDKHLPEGSARGPFGVLLPMAMTISHKKKERGVV